MSEAGPAIRDDGVFLKGRRAVAEYCKVTEQTIRNWRREDWWRGAKKGPVEVYSKEIDRWLLGAGLAGVYERRGEERPAGERAAAAAAAAPEVDAIAAALNLQELPRLERATGDPEADLATARSVADRLRRVIDAWNIETLTNPAMARLFGQFSEILSKSLQRVVGLETTILTLQERRRELISVADASALLGSFAGVVIGELGALMEEVGAAVKDLEIRTYGSSRIDSEGLGDVLSDLVVNFRERVAEQLQAVPLEPARAEPKSAVA